MQLLTGFFALLGMLATAKPGYASSSNTKWMFEEGAVAQATTDHDSTTTKSTFTPRDDAFTHIYACTEPNWLGECYNYQLERDECVMLGPGSQTIGSAGPDRNVNCGLYIDDNCTFGVSPISWPGYHDLPATGLTVPVKSTKCWGCDPPGQCVSTTGRRSEAADKNDKYQAAPAEKRGNSHKTPLEARRGSGTVLLCTGTHFKGSCKVNIINYGSCYAMMPIIKSIMQARSLECLIYNGEVCSGDAFPIAPGGNADLVRVHEANPFMALQCFHTFPSATEDIASAVNHAGSAPPVGSLSAVGAGAFNSNGTVVMPVDSRMRDVKRNTKHPHFYMCPEANWAGACVLWDIIPGDCMNLPQPLEGIFVGSAGPDEGYLCALFQQDACQGDHTGPFLAPGYSDMKSLGVGNIFASYKCVANK